MRGGGGLCLVVSVNIGIFQNTCNSCTGSENRALILQKTTTTVTNNTIGVNWDCIFGCEWRFDANDVVFHNELSL